MPILPIITRENPNIHTRARRVPRVDDSVRRLMDDMVDTMLDAPGVGLAATQVDVHLRVIVMKVDNQVYQLANPELIRAEGEVVHAEGCLSVPGWVGETRRAGRVVIKGLNRHGKEVRVKGTGLLAQCIQHELDHLEGTLYLDRLTHMDTFRRLSREETMDDIREAESGSADDAGS